LKTLRLIAILLVALGSAFASSANPPTQVGDSFFMVNQLGPFGIHNQAIYYLGSDGSCKQLEFGGALGNEPLAYDASRSGTYTFVSTPGNPLAATLTITLPDENDVLALQFTGDTSGIAADYITSGSFSFLLPVPNTFLTNVSNRVTLRPDDTAVTGFVIEGSSSRFVLVRTVGPTLAEFGVSPVSANPKLGVYSGVGQDLIASGQPWSAVTEFDAQAMGWIFGIAGAFPLNTGSKDVVFFGLLAPGIYTAQASDPTTGASGGSALTEVYILPYSG
jgi:hypothetical protein